MAKRKKQKRYRRKDQEMIEALETRLRELKARVAARKRRKVAAEKQKKARSPYRFSPSWVASHREKLGVSAADYAGLVGVSQLTIYNWEKGNSRPRAAQLERLAEARRLSRTEALEELGIGGPTEPPSWYSPKWVARHRERLELSAADYGELVGVTGQTVYAWEQGRTTPRAEQIAALGDVRKMGKREARAKLGY